MPDDFFQAPRNLMLVSTQVPYLFDIEESRPEDHKILPPKPRTAKPAVLPDTPRRIDLD